MPAVLVLAAILKLAFGICIVASTSFPAVRDYDPCCAFPCQNGGVCLASGSSFQCDCTGTGYFGRTCHRATWYQWFQYNLCRKDACTWLIKYSPVSNVVNKVDRLHNRVMKSIYLEHSALAVSFPLYTSPWDYTTLDAYFNHSHYTIALPPIPRNCPKAMGVTGPVTLPSIDEVFELLLEHREFIPDPRHTNLLFAMYAQHFGLQFLQTITSSAHGVDASQVYGKDEETRLGRRSGKCGKLKTVIIQDEEFPPSLEDLPELDTNHPQTGSEGGDPERAMGHRVLSMSPLLFVVATVWTREHNRVCSILHKEHPSWDDERLYQTARLVVTGEMLKVTLEDFMQHLTQYRVDLKYRPELLRGTSHQYGYRVFQEFNLLHLWLTMLPDQIKVVHKTYNMADLLNSNNRIVLEHTFDGFVETLVHTNAGKPKHRNHGKALGNIGKAVINRARQLHLQSFNNYRRKFRLVPYTSFQELVGEPALAKKLEEIYMDIEALELYPGLLLEKAGKAIVPPTMLALSSHWIVTAILSNPIGSPHWWKPSTFGGEVGMSIVKKATLERLFCQNMKSQCRSLEVSFTVPKSKSTEIGPYLGGKNDPHC